MKTHTVATLAIMTIVISAIAGGSFVQSCYSDNDQRERHFVSMRIGRLVYQNIEKDNLTDTQIDSVFNSECGKIVWRIWDGH